MSEFPIRPAVYPQDTPAIIAIWEEFLAAHSVDLSHQNNAPEFAAMPGKYAPPGGCVLLAERGGAMSGEICGVIAFRPVDSTICEMKRLFVRPAARGSRLGAALVERLITEARAAGYREIRLDVITEFAAAQRLYRAFGFVPAPPVTHNPLPGTQFLGLVIA